VSKTFFIIGGAGFVGSRIAKELTDSGNKVIVYDAFLNFVSPSHSDYKFFLNYRLEHLLHQVRILKGDIRNREYLDASIREFNPEYVIHLAALADAIKSREFPREAKAINVDGTTNVLKAITRLENLERFVFASSSFIYGNFQHHPADEEHPLNPIDIYGKTKVLGEKLTKKYCTEAGIDYTIIRPSAVYGYGDANKRVVQLFIESALEGSNLELYYGGETKIDFTYIDDLVDGFTKALFSKKAADQTFNITFGQGRSVRQLALLIKDYIPGTKIVTKSEAIKRPERGALDVTKTKKLLGYNPEFNLENGIKKYFQDILRYNPDYDTFIDTRHRKRRNNVSYRST